MEAMKVSRLIPYDNVKHIINSLRGEQLIEELTSTYKRIFAVEDAIVEAKSTEDIYHQLQQLDLIKTGHLLSIIEKLITNEQTPEDDKVILIKTKFDRRTASHMTDFELPADEYLMFTTTPLPITINFSDENDTTIKEYMLRTLGHVNLKVDTIPFMSIPTEAPVSIWFIKK